MSTQRLVHYLECGAGLDHVAGGLVLNNDAAEARVPGAAIAAVDQEVGAPAHVVGGGGVQHCKAQARGSGRGSGRGQAKGAT